EKQAYIKPANHNKNGNFAEMKESPKAQQNDCRDYCEKMGYQVHAVYQDIKKYRVGNRLVQPSGTRTDRPEFQKMLSDARDGKLDVIIAWREDRLYRSYRPMLDVLDCLDQADVDLELVKETFDKKMAPVKAWAARMELDARHNRYVMGIATNRLAKGKPLNHPPPFGYTRDSDGRYKINPKESKWVTKLFTWYADGDSWSVIRKRFINLKAPQRNEEATYLWNATVLQRMLRNKLYWTGVHNVNWDGTIYGIPIPVIIEPELAQRVLERKKRFKRHPAG
ncbi:unnamed protein product, partial [marine sediment metagenome]